VIPEPLRTAHLLLVPKTRRDAEAMIENMTPEVKAELSADWLAQLRASADIDPWVHGFTARFAAGGIEIGTGMFKGPPVDGMVEIAYGVDEEHRGKGYATEIAAALARYALASSEVSVVRAHTLPGGKASQKVLAKCGFQHVGEVVDPQDGLVWRFEKKV